MDKRKFSFKGDSLLLITGMVLIASLVFVYQNPYNQFAVLTACSAGGLINIINGMKMMKDPKKKATGITLLLMGAVLVVLGFVIIRYIKDAL